MKRLRKSYLNKHEDKIFEILGLNPNFMRRTEKKDHADLIEIDDTPIFELLKDKNICYAVGVNESGLKLKGTGMSAVEYFILINKKDIKKLSGKNSVKKPRHFNFFFTESNKKVYERDLERHEIDEFKLMDGFIRVQNDENGRIWELKNESFKERYEFLNNK